MAQNELIALVSVAFMYAFAFVAIGRLSVKRKNAIKTAEDMDKAYRAGWDAAQQSDLTSKIHDAYLLGWNEAKQVYYTDIREERKAEEERQRQQMQEEMTKLNSENTEFLPISSDLLMAYGVTRVGDLPKQVREAYGITDKYNRLDLDTMVQLEQGGVADE